MRVSWVFVIIVTAVTLIISSFGLLKGSIVEWSLFAEADGFVGLLILELTKRINEPTIIIRPIHKLLKVGFSVSVKDRSINDARVMCNDVPINWEDLDDTPHSTLSVRLMTWKKS